MTNENLLKPFALKPSALGRVLGSEFNSQVEEIRNTYPLCQYDHRPTISEWEKTIHEGALMTEEYRVGHAAFKYTVSKILQPKRMLEIGVRSGVSARAFLEASPEASLVGLDNCSGSKIWGFDFEAHAKSILSPYRVTLLEFNSQNVTKFADKEEFKFGFDFIHIDGDHNRECVAHDVEAAIKTKPRWILIDDARDTSAIVGFWEGVRHEIKGVVDWAYFEDTFTGNILLGLGQHD